MAAAVSATRCTIAQYALPARLEPRGGMANRRGGRGAALSRAVEEEEEERAMGAVRACGVGVLAM